METRQGSRSIRMLTAWMLVLLLGTGSGGAFMGKGPMVRSSPFLGTSWEAEGAVMPLALGMAGTFGDRAALRENAGIMRLYLGAMALAFVGLLLIFFEPWNSGPKSSLKK